MLVEVVSHAIMGYVVAVQYTMYRIPGPNETSSAEHSLKSL